MTPYLWCLVLLGLLGSLIGAPVVWAQGAPATGSISGVISDGSASDQPAAGVPVLLRVIRNGKATAEIPATTDSSGAFHFDSLEVGPSVGYDLSAVYSNVTYEAEPITLTTSKPEQTAQLQVFESSTSDPGLHSTRALLVIGGVDAVRQELVMMEMVTVANPSTKTFVPSPGAAGSPNGPMSIVRFGLPAGASSLAPVGGLDPQQMIQVNTGFASLAPLPPGQQAFSYSYRVPYTGATTVLDKSLPYGADQFMVLAPESGPVPTGDGLTPADTMEFGAMRFRTWTATNVAAGTHLALTVRGLPVLPFWQKYPDVWLPPVLLIVILGGGVAWFSRRRVQGSGRTPASALQVPQTPAPPQAMANA